MAETQGVNATQPFVSIVIPIYNRAKFLVSCLRPLFQQTYLLDRYEIILVDDGSVDDTVVRANELAREWPGKLRIIQKGNGGPASARNAGYRASDAQIIAFLDSDCIVGPDWLTELVRGFNSPRVAGVGAPVVGYETQNWVARYMNAMDFYRHRVCGGEVDYLVTGNAAFRREVLNEVNGFEDKPGVWVEDVDLSYKIKEAGYTLVVVNEGAATHYGTPTSVTTLAKNLFRYGQGNYLLLGRQGQRGQRRNPAFEIIRHSGAIILAPLILLRKTGSWRTLSFWPLVVVEHGAFVAGMLHAWYKTHR